MIGTRQRQRARIGLCLILALYLMPALASDVRVRSSISPENPWVGQRVLLKIDVLAADAWAQVTSFGVIEIAGAYVLPLQDQGVRLQETIDGVAYSGQQYEISLFPQRAGTLKLEAHSLDVQVRQLGGDGETSQQAVELPQLEFSVRLPPGAEGIEGLISTRSLKASQSWEPQVTELKVGDAIQRTLRFEAEDHSGMAFLPLQQPDIPGLGLYPAEPRVDDRYDRGALTGSRVESITYVAQQPGRFTLPAVTLSWWDLNAEKLQQIVLDGVELRVSGVPAVQGALSRGGLDGRWLALGLLLLVGLIALRRPVQNAWRQRRQRLAESEARYFKALQQAIRKDQPQQIHAALMRWLDRINAGQRPMRLDHFLADHAEGMDAAAIHAQLLGSEKLERQQLLDGLSRARNHWQKCGVEGILGDTLPPLNKIT